MGTTKRSPPFDSFPFLPHKKMTAPSYATCGALLLVVNVHIPKTGGSTVSDFLNRCTASQKKRFAYGHMHNFLAMPPAVQDHVMAIDAHMGYGIHLHPRFPKHRVNCTLYTTVVRPYPDILWSAFRFQNQSKLHTSIETFEGNLGRFREQEPWAFLGSISWQLCCWSDSQHPPNSIYDASGFLKREGVNTHSTFPEHCPNTLDRAMHCAIHNLCHRFHIVGETSKLDSFLNRLRDATGCSHIPYRTTNVHTKSTMLYDYIDRFESWVARNGSSRDTAVMRIGGEIALHGRAVCSSF